MKLNSNNELIMKMPELQGKSQTELDIFRDYYNSAMFHAGNSITLEFNNRDNFHAAIVMSEIFKNSKKSIKIFAGDLNGKISNISIYKKELEAAINRGVSVTAIVEQTPSDESESYEILKKYKNANNKVIIKKLTSEFLESYKNNLKHFTIADDNMYRYEINTLEHKAICNYDDLETVSVLVDNFNILYINSDSI